MVNKVIKRSTALFLVILTIAGSGWGNPAWAAFITSGTSQWDNVSTGINFADGNVGIGTTNPAYTLDLNTGVGRAQIWGATGSLQGNTVTSWSTNQDLVLQGRTGYGVNIQYNGGTSGLYLNAAGNVGIGITNPTTKLYVNGGTGNSINIGGGQISGLNSTPLNSDHAVPLGYLQSNYTPSGTAAGGVGNGTAGQTLRHNGTSWIANSVLYNNGTNIGIGTTIPRSKLDVSNGVLRVIGSDFTSPEQGVIVAKSVIPLSQWREVAQGANVTVTGGTLVSDGPTARNGKGRWDITSFPQTITLYMPGSWWTRGLSFTSGYIYESSYPNNKLPGSFLVEKSDNGTTWTTVADVTNNTDWYFYSNNLSDAPYIRITARAAQAGQTASSIANIQVFDASYAGAGAPFSLNGAGNAVFIGGNVGIGTTNPGSKLEVNGAILLPANGTLQHGTVWNSGVLTILNGPTTYFKFDVPNNRLENRLGKYYVGGTIGSYGTIDNYDVTLVASSTERMRIATSGNVGIGTTAPTARLDVRGSGSTDGHLYVGDGTFSNPGSWDQTINLESNQHARILIEETSTGVQTSLWAHTGGNAKVGTVSSHNFSIMTGGTDRITATTGGNVGIGTTSPNTKLYVNGGTGNSINAGGGHVAGLNSTPFNSDHAVPLGYLQDNYTSGLAFVQGGNSFGAAGVLGTNDNNLLNIETNNTVRLTVAAGGNVGIGLTNPAAIVDIYGSNPNPRLTTTGSWAGWSIYNAGSEKGRYAWNTVNGTYIYDTSGVGTSFLVSGGGTSMFIQNSGNVGIGTTAPNEKLKVNGRASFSNNTLTETILWPNVYDTGASRYVRNVILNTDDMLAYAIDRGYTITANRGPDSGTLKCMFWPTGSNCNKPYWNNVSPANPVVISMTALPNMAVDRMIIVPSSRNRLPLDYKVETYDIYTAGNWVTRKNVTGETSPYIKYVDLNTQEGVQQIIITVTNAGDGDAAGQLAISNIVVTSRYQSGRFTGYAVSASGDVMYGNLGIGDTNPTTRLSVSGSSGDNIYVNQGQIGGLAEPVRTDHAVRLGYLQSNYTPSGTAAGGVGNGTAGQTLMHNGTSWIANSVIFNNGTNVGIGTASPGVKLDISGSARILAGNNLSFQTSGGTIRGYIQATDSASNQFILATSGGEDIAFKDGGLSGDTNMVIDGALGYVGIGTTNPTRKLQIGNLVSISTTTPDAISLGATYSSVAGNNIKLRVYDDGSSMAGFGVSGNQLDYKVWSSTADHVFYQGTTELMRIDGEGNVGIGVVSPNAKLEVNGSLRFGNTSTQYVTSSVDGNGAYVESYGSAAATNRIRIQNSNRGGAATYNGIMIGESTVGSGSGIQFYTGAFGNNRMVINSNGNVGVGTTTVTSKFKVDNSTGEAINVSGGQIAGLNSTPVNTDHAVPFGFLDSNYARKGTGVGSAFVQGGNSFGTTATLGTNDNYALNVETNNSVRMTIASNGNVGIGYTNPKSKFQVLGPVYGFNLAGANLVPYASNMRYYNANVIQMPFVDGKSITALNSPQDGTGACYQWGATSMFPVDPRQDYEYSIWAQSNGQQSIYMGFYVYDSNGTLISDGGLGNPYFHTSTQNTNGGWRRISAFLRSSETPRNTDYTAVTKSNKTDPSASDWVMPETAAYAMMRWGSCYGGTTTTGRVYLYNPSVVGVEYDENYGAIWSKFNGTTYNTGLGTTNPLHRLQVSGGNASLPTDAAFSVVKNEEAYGLFVGVEGSGNSWLQSGTRNNATKYNLTLQPQGGNTIINPSSGNVGIGTTAPGYRLDVHSASNAVPIVSHIGTASSATHGIYFTPYGTGHLYNTITVGTSEDLRFETGGISSPTTVMTIKSGGNVGIGTTAPSTKMHVAGETGDAINAGGGHVAGLNSTPFRSDHAVPLGYLQSNYLPTPVSSSSAAWLINGNNLINDTSWLGSINNYDISFRTNNTERIRVTKGGNVGIGTSNPGSYKLNVAGDLYTNGFITSPNVMSGVVYAESATLFRALNEPGGWVKIWDSGGGSVYTTNFRITGSYDNRTNNLEFRVTTSGYGQPHSIVMLPTTNYNAGTVEEIRTNNVSNTQLEVWVKLSAVGALYTGNIIVHASDTGLVSPLTLTTTQPTWGTKSVAVYPQQDMANLPLQLSSPIRSYSTSINYFAGNVGVGTTNPTTPWSRVLQVYDASNAGLSVKTSGKEWHIMSDAYNYLGFVDYNGGAYSRRMVIDTEGKVGIGITNPAKKLQVHGDIALSNGGKIGQGNGWGTDANTYNATLELYNSSTGYTTLQSATAYGLLLNPSGGKVGIGSSTPVNKLDVYTTSNDAVHVGGRHVAGLDLTPTRADHAASKYYVDNNFAPSGGASKWTDGASGSIYRNSNVGIGTSAPRAPLEVISSTSQDYIWIGSAAETSWSGIRIQNDRHDQAYVFLAGSTYSSYGGPDSLNIYNSVGPISIDTGSDEVVRFHGSGGVSIGDAYVANDPGVDSLIVEGNVGIGNTAPAFKLDVSGPARFNYNYRDFQVLQGASSNNLVRTWNGVLVAGSDSSGALTYTVIETNVPQDSAMMGGFKIQWLENYSSTNGKTTIELAGYWNPESNGGFTGFEYQSSNPGLAPTIRVARNISTGMTAFILTHFSSSYPIIIARDLWLSYSGGNTNHGDGWSMLQTSDISGYTNLDTVVARVGTSGSGTQNYITKWTGASSQGNSVLYDNGTNVGLGTTAPSQKLHVSGNIRTSGDIISDGNYGLGLVGLYSPTRYQNVFAMGASYRLAADGTTPGNLYGIAWTHTNVGGQSKSGLAHQALFMNNGVTQTAIGTGIWTLGGYTQSGTSINSFGGNVGIGTASPATRLHAAGISVDSINSGGGHVAGLNSVPFRSDHAVPLGFATSTFFMHAGNSFGTTATLGTNDNHPLNIETNNSVKMTVAANGNVGIGLTNPTQKLDVSGNIRLSGVLFGDTDSSRNLAANNIYTSGVAGYQHTNGMLLTSGTLNRINFSRESSYTTNYAKVLSPGYYSVSFWYKVENYVSGSTINVNLNDTSISNFDVSSNKAWTFYSGTAYISSTSYGFIDFEGTFSSTITLSDLVIVRSAKPATQYVLAPEDIVQVNTNNNVGIGTTNALAKLQINPPSSVEGVRIISSDYSPLVIRNSTDTADIFRIDQNGNITGSLGGNSTAWSRNNTTGEIYATNVNDLVGIGTTDPQQKLEVAGNIRMTGDSFYFNGSNAYLRSESIFSFLTNGGSAQGGRLKGLMLGSSYNQTAGSAEIITSTNESLVLDASGTGTMIFQTGNNTRMTLANNGNLGIGTTAPQKVLEVITPSNGYASFANQISVGAFTGIHFGYRESNQLYRKSALVFERTDHPSFGNNASGKIHFLLDNSGSNSADTLADSVFTINEFGNVGVGTTNPSAKLNIVNSSNENILRLDDTRTAVSGDFLSKISFNGYAGGERAYVGMRHNEYFGDTPSALVFGVTGSERMRISSTGNVGIRNTNPTSTLSIIGVTGDNIFVSNGHIGGLPDPVRADHAVRLGYIQSNYEPSMWYSGASGSIYRNSNVGIGLTNPSSKLHVSGDMRIVTTIAVGEHAPTEEVVGDFYRSYTGTTNAFALNALRYQWSGTNSGTLYGLRAAAQTSNTGNLAGAIGVYATALQSGTGTLTNAYSVYAESPAGTISGQRWNIYAAGTANSYFGGNVGIGTTDPGAYKLKVTGNVAVTGTFETQTGSDFAEEFLTEEVIRPGSVVVMGDLGYKSVKLSVRANDKTVVGVVSDNPSIIAGRVEAKEGENKAIVAMAGVVSVLVNNTNGSIEKGDLLVSSGVAGYAMKSDGSVPGTVIGKALEDMKAKRGRIKVLINLQ